MTVGQKIKSRRLELNMSQEELAKKCGYKSRSSINKIEMSRDLPLKKVRLMADALDLSVSYLMGWDEEAESYSHIGEKLQNIQNSSESFVAINEEESNLVSLFRELDEESQRQIVLMMAFLKSQGK